ncbi:MAG TPA: crystallin J1 [Verrucomicrobiales bacterium]|nr:crystallin J1 [Verrucomicrobiales bacterium]HRJ06947.1 ADP-ribosylglycohydrolase family protein [Prosthecobacter sp.]HRK13054.1 ADP-ribosylglycohydrolase family protein [Prosthecobacter sp.]
MTSSTHAERLERTRLSLDGLSVGDAFGQMLSSCARSARNVVEPGGLPSGPWWHTDDTQMAMAIVEELVAHGQIATDSLARRFAERYQADPGRGYGKGARMQLEEIAAGESWRTTAAAAFNGRGSKGNGSAMRVAPLGAWFADDPAQIVSQSTLSSVVTHSHPEGVAGSIAVSLAAAGAWASRILPLEKAREWIWDAVLGQTPAGETLEGIRKARLVPLEMSAENAARILGSGFLVTAPDTVPFAIWCAIRHLDCYSEALLATLEGDGDCDANCAIVGGIVSLRVGRDGITADWLASREPLDLRLRTH